MAKKKPAEDELEEELEDVELDDLKAEDALAKKLEDSVDPDQEDVEHRHRDQPLPTERHQLVVAIAWQGRSQPEVQVVQYGDLQDEEEEPHDRREEDTCPLVGNAQTRLGDVGEESVSEW